MMWKSGSGHTTMMNMALTNYPKLKYVCSYVTREPRPWEINWEKYIFITKEEFEKWIKLWEFLEYALVHKLHYYGTKIKDIETIINDWWIGIKEVDIEWLEQIKQNANFDFFSLFLDIDEKTMRKRILSRSFIAEDELEQRLISAKNELKKAKILCDEILDASGTIEDNWIAISKILNKII